MPGPEIAETTSSLSGVAGGGGAGFGAFWLMKFLFKQDKEAIKELAGTVRDLTNTVTELRLEVAKLSVHVQNAQKGAEKIDLTAAQVVKLEKDIAVAHGRIRLLASGKPIKDGNCNG